MSEFDTLETEAKTEFGKIDTTVKLEYTQIMAILRAHFGGDHPVIADVKKLAVASSIAPESVSAAATPETIAGSSAGEASSVTGGVEFVD